jgi:hypothetical protein
LLRKGSLINMTFRNKILSRKTALLVALLAVSHSVMSQQPGWTATWTASPEAADPYPNEPLTNLDNQTVRERVRVTVAGKTSGTIQEQIASLAQILKGNLLALHPTPKPVALIVDAIKGCTARGDLVLDPFLGVSPLNRLV